MTMTLLTTEVLLLLLCTGLPGMVEAFRPMKSSAFLRSQSPSLQAKTAEKQEDAIAEEMKPFYLLGMNVASQPKEDLRPLLSKDEIQLLIDGFRDEMEGNDIESNLLEDYGPVFQEELNQRVNARSVGEISAGNEFALEYLKANPESKLSPSGLIFHELEESDGVKPTIMSTVTIHNVGRFIDGSILHDTAASGFGPATFELNQALPGYIEGITMMSEGSTARIIVPANLAYGDAGLNTDPPVKPGQTLVFDITLLKVDTPEDASENNFAEGVDGILEAVEEVVEEDLEEAVEETEEKDEK
jgi:FKBP-type peptidyl-prolyl cis-trans isomerase